MKRALVVLALVALTAGGIWVNWYARHRAVTPPAAPAPPPAAARAAALGTTTMSIDVRVL